MTFEEICSVLVREPFHLGFEQIADLTDYQITNILFREPPGEKRQPSRSHTSYEEIFRRVWRQRGLTEADIDRKWQEYGNGQSTHDFKSP